MRARLTPRDSAVEVAVSVRRQWCQLAIAEPARSAARSRIVEAMASELDKSRSWAYDLVRRYERDPRDETLRPRERSDRKEARKASAPEGWEADAFRKWAVAWLIERSRLAWPFTKRCRKLREVWVEMRGEELPVADETLRQWVRDVDPHFARTKKERMRAAARRLEMVAIYSNEVWQCDARRADLEVVDPTTGEVYRPWLVHFVDVLSGTEMGGGYYREYDSQSVEDALLDAIYPSNDRRFCGTPELLYWDNGKQFTSHWIDRVLETLGVEVSHSIPKEPQSHGRVEATHLHAAADFELEFESYVGGDNKPENKPLRLRLVKDGEARPPRRYTLEQLNEAWYWWLASDYDWRSYKRGEPRASRWMAGIGGHPERHAVPDPEQLLIHLLDKTHRQVRDGCVKINEVHYTSPHLAELNGERVEVRFHRQHFWRIYILRSDGTVHSIAEPRDPHRYLQLDGIRDLKARNAERRADMRRFDETARSLEAAGELGLADPVTAAAAAEARGFAQLPDGHREVLKARIAELGRKPQKVARKGGPLVLLPEPEVRAVGPQGPDEGLIDAVIGQGGRRAPAAAEADPLDALLARAERPNAPL